MSLWLGDVCILYIIYRLSMTFIYTHICLVTTLWLSPYCTFDGFNPKPTFCWWYVPRYPSWSLRDSHKNGCPGLVMFFRISNARSFQRNHLAERRILRRFGVQKTSLQVAFCLHDDEPGMQSKQYSCSHVATSSHLVASPMIQSLVYHRFQLVQLVQDFATIHRRTIGMCIASQ